VTEYAILRRADLGVWQAIAGGGEDQESPEAAAAREAFEEAGISPSLPLERLASIGAVPVEHFAERRSWDPTLRTIPEFSFSVDVGTQPIEPSPEHSAMRWAGFNAALECLEWESNRAALRELDERLKTRPSRSGVHAV
jgi:dATP pyrophosphohydrolase